MAPTAATSRYTKNKRSQSFLKAKAAARISHKKKADPMPLPASSDSSASDYELIPVQKGARTTAAMSGIGGSRSAAHLTNWSQRPHEANAEGYEYRVQKKKKKNKILNEPLLSQFGRGYYAHENVSVERERLDSAYATVAKHIRSLFGKRRHELLVTHPGGARLAPGSSESMDFERLHVLVDILKGFNGNNLDLHLTIVDNSQDSNERIPAPQGTVTGVSSKTSRRPDRGRAYGYQAEIGESSRSGADGAYGKSTTSASRGAHMTAGILLNDNNVREAPGMTINHLHPIPRTARGVPFTAPNDQRWAATAADEEDCLDEEIVEISTDPSPVTSAPPHKQFIQKFRRHNEDGARNAKRRYPGIDQPEARPRKRARGNNVVSKPKEGHVQAPAGGSSIRPVPKKEGNKYWEYKEDTAEPGNDEMYKKLLNSKGPSQQIADGRYSLRQRPARNYNAEASGGDPSRRQPVANASGRTSQLRANTVYGEKARLSRAALQAEAHVRRE